MSTTTATASKLAVIFAGEEFSAVEMLDGSLAHVRVRAMPVRHLGKVLGACTDEAALLDIVCLVPAPEGDTEARAIPGWQPLPTGFVDNLTDVSHIALFEAAKKLNFSRAAAWGERQIAAKQFQAPLLLKADEVLMPVVEQMASLILSRVQSGSPVAPTAKS